MSIHPNQILLYCTASKTYFCTLIYSREASGIKIQHTFTTLVLIVNAFERPIAKYLQGIHVKMNKPQANEVSHCLPWV